MVLYCSHWTFHLCFYLALVTWQLSRENIQIQKSNCILLYSAVRFKFVKLSIKYPFVYPCLRKYSLCWPMSSERCIPFLFRALCASCLCTSPPFSKGLKKEDGDSSEAIGGGHGLCSGWTLGVPASSRPGSTRPPPLQCLRVRPGRGVPFHKHPQKLLGVWFVWIWVTGRL